MIHLQNAFLEYVAALSNTKVIKLTIALNIVFWNFVDWSIISLMKPDLWLFTYFVDCLKDYSG